LTLYFLLIVGLPMVAIAVLVSSIATDSSTGKTDAALNEDLEVANDLYRAHIDRALSSGEAIARRPEVREALAEGDERTLDEILRELTRKRGFEELSLDLGGARALGRTGPGFAAATIELEGSGGTEVGSLTVSKTSPAGFAGEVASATGEQVVVVTADGALGSVTEQDVSADDVPEAGDADDLEAGGEDDLRIAAAELPASEGARIGLIAPSDSPGFLASRPGIAIAVGVFILLALLAAGLITRTLQGQIASMLAAARRIGEGDFSGELPVVGNDELAGLAREFNEMRDRLSEQMDRLRHQQSEIEKSVSRIGEAFASGLDRPALLRILVETAIDACEAEYAIVALSGHAGAEAEAGGGTEVVKDVALAAEHRALREVGAVAADLDGAHALASSLGRIGAEGAPVGAMTVARTGPAFTTTERDVFLYLVGQAAASVENVALHELVSEQAVTDDLTGLPNNRAFREAIEKEAARAARFRHELSLLVVDIDDFKQVNDRYGHLQGDAVLRMIGTVLAEESRGIDEPARYGGEEFVVALPETGLEGALEVAERIRARIEKEAVARIEGRGKVRVTASIGVAAMPGAATEVPRLIAAADAALYEAKRAGKNRVSAAEGNGAEWRTDAE
jgi:diguanylate cyclase (GGDEF)-like protein